MGTLRLWLNLPPVGCIKDNVEWGGQGGGNPLFFFVIFVCFIWSKKSKWAHFFWTLKYPKMKNKKCFARTLAPGQKVVSTCSRWNFVYGLHVPFARMFMPIYIISYYLSIFSTFFKICSSTVSREKMKKKVGTKNFTCLSSHCNTS